MQTQEGRFTPSKYHATSNGVLFSCGHNGNLRRRRRFGLLRRSRLPPHVCLMRIEVGFIRFLDCTRRPARLFPSNPSRLVAPVVRPQIVHQLQFRQSFRLPLFAISSRNRDDCIAPREAQDPRSEAATVPRLVTRPFSAPPGRCHAQKRNRLFPELPSASKQIVARSYDAAPFWRCFRCSSVDRPLDLSCVDQNSRDQKAVAGRRRRRNGTACSILY